MSKTDKFEAAWNGPGRGATVLAVSNQLCPGCLHPDEVDTNIAMLKADLDEAGRRMKALIAKHKNDPLWRERSDA